MPDVPATLRALEADRVREVVGLSLGKMHGVAETDGAELAAAVVTARPEPSSPVPA